MQDIGMIAADTSRTIIYFKSLIKNQLIPNYVLLLLNNDEQLLPGQKTVVSRIKLLKLLEKENIQYEISSNHNINSEAVINQLKKRKELVFIFSGFGGILLQDEILGIGKKFQKKQKNLIFH